MKAIRSITPPTSVSELRSFLGMTQFVSRYIDAYATITEPLRRLTRKSEIWKWGQQQEGAFKTLKNALSGVGVMAYFDLKKLTEILVDASPFGLGAMLTQHGRVVCYASRALIDMESRYSQTERSIRCGKISYIPIWLHSQRHHRSQAPTGNHRQQQACISSHRSLETTPYAIPIFSDIQAGQRRGKSS